MSKIDINERHKEEMRARQAEHRARIRERKALDRGLLLVYTGDGKGKSTSAFGTVIRSLGWGHSVAVVQFVKGKWRVGEREFFDRLEGLVPWFTMGEGFTWDTQDRDRDIAAARAAWRKSLELITSGDYDLVVLDELNIVLRDEYLEVNEVVQGLLERSQRTSVIVTGRDAKPELLKQADLVSEIRAVRHPFENGFRAKRGIDF